MKREWQLQEAKNRFSEVVKEALASGLHWMTRHGKRAAVILSAFRLRRQECRRQCAR